MNQNEIRPPEGSKKHSKRVGRGDASGHGSFPVVAARARRQELATIR